MLRMFKDLDDWYSMKEYGLIEDYSDILYEYFAKNFLILSTEERFYTLSESIILNLISYSLSQKKSHITLPDRFLPYIPNLKIYQNSKDSSTRYIIHSKLNPINHQEIIQEGVFWLRQIYEKQNQEYFEHGYDVFYLLISILINVDKLNENLLEEIINVLKLVHPGEVVECSSLFTELCVCKKEQQIYGLRKKFLKKQIYQEEKSRDQQQLQQYLEGEYVMFNFDDQDTMALELELKNEGNEDDNYDKSDKDYRLDQRTQAIRIQAANKIVKRFFNKNMFLSIKKQRERLVKSQLINWNLVTLLNQYTSDQTLEVYARTIVKNNFVFELMHLDERVKRNIINTYYQTYVDNSLDFHYFVFQLNKNRKILQSLIQKTGEVILSSNNEKFELELKTFFIESRKELEYNLQSFADWKIVNVKYEPDAKALLNKNKKIITIKWNQRSLHNKAKAIAKKRAGIKKQRILQEKKMMLKK